MDEAEFHSDIITSTRNLYSWSYDNPHEVVHCNFQHRFLVNVWYGIMGSHLCGLHFVVEEHFILAYRNFLENELHICLENVLQRNDMWMQHDGTPPHFGREVS
jgi:hypothetical protein